MALQKDYNFKGILVKNAYHRIYLGQCFKDIDGLFKLRFDVEISAVAGGDVIEVVNGYRAYTCVYDIVVTTNAITQAYNYLMTLPEYTGSVQV